MVCERALGQYAVDRSGEVRTSAARRFALLRNEKLGIMKTSLKSVIETLNRDANQLERCAQRLKTVSSDVSFGLGSDAEMINDRVASIRKQVESMEGWE